MAVYCWEASGNRSCQWCSSGHLHHRLHNPHRVVRRFLHVPLPQGPHRGSFAHRRGGSSGSHDFGELDPRLCSRTVFLVGQRDHGSRPGGLRLYCLGAAGVDVALSARLFEQFPENRHYRFDDRRCLHGQSNAALPNGEPCFLERRPDFLRQCVPVRFHLHHVRRHLRISCPGCFRHHAQDDLPRIGYPAHRLRRHALGRVGRRHGFVGGSFARPQALL